MTTARVPVLDQYEWQKSVKDKDLSSPPINPSRGDRYIVGSNPQGNWNGNTNKIAEWNGGIWEFYDVFDGMMIFVIDEKDYYHFIDNSWTALRQVIQRRDIVINTNVGRQLLIGELGITFITDSSNEITFILPSVDETDINSQVTFVRLGSGKFIIRAADLDKIADSSAGGTIYSDIANEFYPTMTLMLVKADHWIIRGGHGTWKTS